MAKKEAGIEPLTFCPADNFHTSPSPDSLKSHPQRLKALRVPLLGKVRPGAVLNTHVFNLLIRLKELRSEQY